MSRYRCGVCGGTCDPGELVGGVCAECREEAQRRSERILRICRVIKEQENGQMMLEAGNGL